MRSFAELGCVSLWPERGHQGVGTRFGLHRAGLMVASCWLAHSKLRVEPWVLCARVSWFLNWRAPWWLHLAGLPTCWLAHSKLRVEPWVLCEGKGLLVPLLEGTLMVAFAGLPTPSWELSHGSWFLSWFLYWRAPREAVSRSSDNLWLSTVEGSQAAGCCTFGPLSLVSHLLNQHFFIMGACRSTLKKAPGHACLLLPKLYNLTAIHIPPKITTHFLYQSN